MSAPKFTAGPWVIYPGTDGTEICAVDRTPGLPIRQIITRPVRGDNWIANATLLAHAPELYEALVEAETQLVHDWHKIDNEWGPSGETPDCDETIARVRAALAKARGAA